MLGITLSELVLQDNLENQLSQSQGKARGNSCENGDNFSRRSFCSPARMILNKIFLNFG
jgi:hypothetical protein